VFTGYTRDKKRLVSPGSTADSGTQDRPNGFQRKRHSGLAQGAADALVGHLFVPIDAVGVYTEQHLHRVTSSLGHPRRGNTALSQAGCSQSDSGRFTASAGRKAA